VAVCLDVLTSCLFCSSSSYLFWVLFLPLFLLSSRASQVRRLIERAFRWLRRDASAHLACLAAAVAAKHAHKSKQHKNPSAATSAATSAAKGTSKGATRVDVAAAVLGSVGRVLGAIQPLVETGATVLQDADGAVTLSLSHTYARVRHTFSEKAKTPTILSGFDQPHEASV